MEHSHQIREFLLTSQGARLVDVYVGPEGVLTGSMRRSQEAREQAGAAARTHEREARQRELQRRRHALEAQLAALRAEFESVAEETDVFTRESLERERLDAEARSDMGRRRGSGDGKGAP